jgi:hypothetical protein
MVIITNKYSKHTRPHGYIIYISKQGNHGYIHLRQVKINCDLGRRLVPRFFSRARILKRSLGFRLVYIVIWYKWISLAPLSFVVDSWSRPYHSRQWREHACAYSSSWRSRDYPQDIATIRFDQFFIVKLQTLKGALGWKRPIFWKSE